MEANPSSLGVDLDGNSVTDFFSGTASGLTIPQTYTGVAVSSQSAGTPQILFRADIGGSILRNNLASGDPYTFEWRVRKTGGTQGSQGWFAAAFQSPGDNYSARVSLKDNGITFRDGTGAFIEYESSTNFGDGNFHTVRLAKESGNEYYVWVNEILLNDNLSTPFTGGNGSFNASGAWFIGDFSGDTAGNWETPFSPS